MSKQRRGASPQRHDDLKLHVLLPCPEASVAPARGLLSLVLVSKDASPFELLSCETRTRESKPRAGATDASGHGSNTCNFKSSCR